MTDDRVLHLERCIASLQDEHRQHEERLRVVSDGVQVILSEVQKLAAGLATHTVDESEKHKARMTMMSRVLLALAGVLALLAAIYSVITGTSLSNSLLPMLKTLIGL